MHSQRNALAATAGTLNPGPRYTGGSAGDAGHLPAQAPPADHNYATITEPPVVREATAALPPTAGILRPRSRERRPSTTRRTARKVSSGRSPDDPEPADPPPPLPWRLGASAGDNSGVEAAFVAILNRRHGTRWTIAKGRS
jgi:hypothetical protein